MRWLKFAAVTWIFKHQTTVYLYLTTLINGLDLSDELYTTTSLFNSRVVSNFEVSFTLNCIKQDTPLDKRYDLFQCSTPVQN